MKAFGLYLSLVLCLFTVPLAHSESVASRADLAVAEILFEYDGSEEYATYRVADDGFVDVTFAVNTPDPLYSEILARLNSHPDINGVLAGKTGSFCPLF
jgi:hypothetical protein